MVEHNYYYALHIKPQDLTKRLQLLIMQVGEHCGQKYMELE